MKVVVSAGRRGSVLIRSIQADPSDPWPGVLQAISRAIKKGDGQLTPADREIRISLAPEGE